MGRAEEESREVRRRGRTPEARREVRRVEGEVACDMSWDSRKAVLERRVCEGSEAGGRERRESAGGLGRGAGDEKSGERPMAHLEDS